MPGSALRICIAAQRPPSISETFIQAHIDRLPGPPYFIHGSASWPYRSCGWFPAVDARTGRIVSHGAELAVRAGYRLGSLGNALRQPGDRQIARFLDRESVSVVVAEYGFAGVEVMQGCLASGVPLVVNFHGFDAYRYDLLSSYRVRYARLFKHSAAIVVGSSSMADQLVSLGAPRHKIANNPLGADTARFTGDPDGGSDDPTFVALGRLVQKKAPDLTIRAFARVVERCPAARLVLIGDGPLRNQCEVLVRDLGLLDAVTLLGSVPNQDIPGHIRGARAVVQHSMRAPDGDAEGTAISVLEAGAMGLPVVATRHAGIRDSIVEGKTGYLVECGDVETMSARMLELASDKQLAARMGAAGQARVRSSYSVDASVARLLEILRAVAQGVAVTGRTT